MSKVIQSRYKICENLEDINLLIIYVKKTKICSFDFETNGQPYQSSTSYPTCIGISFQVGSAWIIPLGHFESPFKKNFIKILQLLAREIFHNTNIIKIAQNISFEIKWLKKYGIELQGICMDTMLAHYLLNENERHGLKEMVTQLIPGFSGYEDEVDTLKKKHGGWDKIPLEPLCKYNGLDCDLTLRLMMYFHQRLIRGKFYLLFRNLLMMETRVLAESEFHGMPVDVDYLDDLTIRYGDKIKAAQDELLNHPFIRKYQNSARKAHINKLVDGLIAEIEVIQKENKPTASRLIQARNDKIRRISSGELTTNKEKYEGLNLGSPKQLLDLFYYSKKGFKFPIQQKKAKNAKTGKLEYRPSTDEPSIIKLRDLKVKDHGFLDRLLTVRELQKLHSTYMVGMQAEVSYDSKVHASYHLLTVTGRLGCREPNMQNVPRCVDKTTIIPTTTGLIKIGDIIPHKKGSLELPGNIFVTTHLGNYKPITHALNKGKQEMFEVELEDGTIFKCTKQHRLLTDKGWMELEDIMLNPNISIIKHD